MTLNVIKDIIVTPTYEIFKKTYWFKTYWFKKLSSITTSYC